MPGIALALLRGSRYGQSGRVVDRTGETTPRYNLFEEAFVSAWDESIVASSSSHTPIWLRLAMEVHRRRTEYDAVVTWGERLSLALMAIQQFSRDSKPHIAMVGQFAKLNVALPMRLFGRSASAFVTWTSVQGEIACRRFGISPSRIYLVPHYVDSVFFRPIEASEDMICSVGAEMRDYVTLVEALRGTDLRCHVATDHVRVPGRVRLLRDRRIPVEAICGNENSNITVGKVSIGALRDLYARSRFVVVPLLPSDSDNGVTVILEAMAMGKAVICSRTRGQVDVIEDGVTGLLVPQGDAGALRSAMLALWNDPGRAHAIGMRARAYAERLHSLEGFVANVRSAAEASLLGQSAPAEGWWNAAMLGAGSRQGAPVLPANS